MHTSTPCTIFARYLKFMIKKYYILLIISLCLVVTACGNKSEKTDLTEEQRIFQVAEVSKNTGLQLMQESHASIEITCQSQKYNLVIDRVPDESLPAIDSEMGRFADNSIKVTLINAQGQPAFQHQFTKGEFASYVSSSFLKQSVLEGIVYDTEKGCSGTQVHLLSSVCTPGTDLYVPFGIIIDIRGGINISRLEE